MSTVKVYSRSKDGDTWAQMREFIPSNVECVRAMNYNRYQDALHYLIDILQADADYIVNVDVDCFIYDWNAVNNRILELHNNPNKAFAGMPDSFENSPHRFGTYECTNPFFNIFKVVQCKEIVSNLTIKQLNDNTFEPFEGFFKALFRLGGRINLKGEVHADGISTILDNAMLHTWYSRDVAHHQRIQDRYNEAVILCKALRQE